ncbi:MAG: hypothetical protein GY811_09310 [Myxococcales bacterium]|nr:hypothetical protein [Myxococcales bacterium]
MKLVGKVNTSATISAAGMVPPKAASMMGGKPTKAAYMSIGVDGGMSAKVGLVFESGDDAKATKKQLDMALALGISEADFKDIIKGVSGKIKGSALVVETKLSGKQIEKLQGMRGGPPL